MEDKLKNVEFLIEDESQDFFGDISLISIVFDPAIKKEFNFFKDINKQTFANVDEEKRLIIGPAMIPNKLILRKNEQTGEYFNCYFSDKTVRRCSELFLKHSNHNKTNLEHGELLNGREIRDDISVVESWIVEDSKNDKANALGFKPIKGEWYVAFKVESPSLWEALKKSGFGGFSIEGRFTEKFSSYSKFKSITLEDTIKGIVFNEGLKDSEKYNLIKNILKVEKK